MMKRLTQFAAVATLLAMVSACDSNTSPAPKDGAIVGMWSRNIIGSYDETYLFRADGTCTKELNVPTGHEMHEGTWEIDSDECLCIAFANGSNEPIRETHRYNVSSSSLEFTGEGDLRYTRLN